MRSRPAFRRLGIAASLLLATLASGAASAADWSDVALGWGVGTRFREPFNPEPIRKNIFSLTWASGYASGDQFFNLDLLKSDHRDPASLHDGEGALEAYVVYRYSFDLGKLSGHDFHVGPLRSFNFTAGFDWNDKHDVGYNSRKRMLVAGPQVDWDVPQGRFNTAVLMAWESNAPHGPFPPISNVHGRYHYQAHPMLALDWALPLGRHWSFEGYADWIAAKGRDETGAVTAAETLVDARLMFDAGAALGLRPQALRLGLRYQYWRNKFGNTRATTGGKGYIASTPMLEAEYHF